MSHGWLLQKLGYYQWHPCGQAHFCLPLHTPPFTASIPCLASGLVASSCTFTLEQGPYDCCQHQHTAARYRVLGAAPCIGSWSPCLPLPLPGRPTVLTSWKQNCCLYAVKSEVPASNQWPFSASVVQVWHVRLTKSGIRIQLAWTQEMQPKTRGDEFSSLLFPQMSCS